MDRELVEQAMHGDEEAFDTLIERIGDSMHSVARRILRDTTLAEDATQQALLDAWRNLPQLARDGGSTPDSSARIAIQEQLDRAFRHLSVEHRTVVVLVHYLGLTPSEAAYRMGTPVGTARSRLHYALGHLRSVIEADARLPVTRGTA